MTQYIIYYPTHKAMMFEQREKDINKIKTSITLKMGTKNRLVEMSGKGESFDDVINRLIRTNENYEVKIGQLEELIKKNNLEPKIKLEISEYSRGINSIRIGENEALKFSYNKPDENIDTNYRMDIIIEELMPDNTKIDDLLSSMKYRLEIYFRIIEKVINLHFDRSFSLPMNKNLLNTLYWRKIWQRIGLSSHSLDHDVMKFINEIIEE